MATEKGKKPGVECPECGSVHTTAHRGGYTPSGLRIRRRECVDCGHRFNSVEVVADFVFEQVDTAAEERYLQRAAARKNRKFSYHPRQRKNSIGDLEVKVTFTPGKPNPWCWRRLHKMTGYNVITTNKGHRQCRQCKNAYDRERQANERRLFPERVRARQNRWRNKNKDRLNARRAELKAERKRLENDVSGYGTSQGHATEPRPA